ncbi:alpha/beta-hydrolase [Periconia macrospinosa]|uniref:Alpha/beta-hydrolase n=1 Tax=Periconia macrospinosa TaxID=97972 RepID=A0A2V1DHP8_9PLEO|nr:alpha/beta-hydrolase [Periconia macrospinosa]
MSTTSKIFTIIATEIGIDASELEDDMEFTELGVDNFLAKSILAEIAKETRLNLPSTLFADYPTPEDLRAHLATITPARNTTPPQPLRSSLKPSKNGYTNGYTNGHTTNGYTNTTPAPPTTKTPLSIPLQTPPTAIQTLFLLPDGSGSGMAYARLPPLSPSITLIALNSPFLKSPPSSTTFTLPSLCALFASEIQRLQPHGPYFLGGWSAGGYYSFEVAKILREKGEEIRKLVLIDSPCRLVFEALPMGVVRWLSAKGLMGNWGPAGRGPPAWLVDHFEVSIRAIEGYAPVAFPQGKGGEADEMEVFLIWAEHGVLRDGAERPQKGELDMKVRITEMLLERPVVRGAQGWERLFPGRRLRVAGMGGNHFTMVYPPHVSVLFFSHFPVCFEVVIWGDECLLVVC